MHKSCEKTIHNMDSKEHKLEKKKVEKKKTKKS